MKRPVIFLAALLSLGTARAEAPNISASLSANSASLGQPVELQIQVQGARSAEVPQQINVDGLKIVHTGQSTQFQMNNFEISTSVTHTYTVVPQRTGTFVIPRLPINVGGKILETEQLTLNVTAGGAPPPASGIGGNPAPGGTASGEMGELTACELIVPKQSAYVGEAIPIEMRVYVDDRVRWQPEQPPVLSSEGLAAQKFTEPRQDKITKDGRNFSLLTYKTAITPAKAGELSVGPAALQCLMELPRPRSKLPRSFEDFFNDPFSAFAVTQRVQLRSNAVPLEVKPLPTANQPADFEGAVGQFSLTSKASAQRVRIGDPVTITLSITGRGNFDRVNAPHVVEEPGWRSYPPSSSFKEDDVVGISGTKTFEMVVIPDERKTRLPIVKFSYFDPVAKKYATLTTEVTPILVEGQNPPVVAQAASPAPGTAATAVAEVAVNDIHYIRTGAARWGRSFEPIYDRPAFWLAQLAPLAALLGFVGLKWRQNRSLDENTLRIASLRRQKSELAKVLQQRDAHADEFFEAAAKSIQLVTAMGARDLQMNAIHAGEACASRTLDEETAAGVKSIFAASDELRYAGKARQQASVPETKREEVLRTIRNFEQSHA
jgi:hypothetical protein